MTKFDDKVLTFAAGVDKGRVQTNHQRIYADEITTEQIFTAKCKLPLVAAPPCRRMTTGSSKY